MVSELITYKDTYDKIYVRFITQNTFDKIDVSYIDEKKRTTSST